MYFFTNTDPQNIKVFTPRTGNSSQSFSWQAWHRPESFNGIMIVAQGPGGGGGGGFAAAAATQRGGGGGGGSGSRSMAILPAILVPRELWVWVGVAGNGGASGVAGGGGTATWVAVQPNVTGVNSLLIGQPGGGGGTGSATVGGPAGSAGTAITGASLPMIGNGMFQSYAGDAGAVGGVSGVGGNKTIAGVLCGGAGGAGTTSGNVNAVGGAVTGAGIFQPTIPAGATNGGAGNDGFDSGIFSPQSFYSFPGSGGGSNGASGTGGRGGNGSYGQGGGGGGAGVTGGAGGKGGDGFVFIIVF